MKFALAIFTYLLMAAILGAGIFLAATGKPLFLIIAFVAFCLRVRQARLYAALTRAGFYFERDGEFLLHRRHGFACALTRRHLAIVPAATPVA